MKLNLGIVFALISVLCLIALSIINLPNEEAENIFSVRLSEISFGHLFFLVLAHAIVSRRRD